MDEFTISIPHERPFTTVAGLVLGGIAARHDVTLDVLDDLQLALDALLEHDEDGGQIGIVLRVSDGSIEASIGPVDHATAMEIEQEAGEGLGLRRLLETVVDDVSLGERNGGSWVDLRKAYAVAEPQR